jgi:hypothetical protein
MIAPVSIRRFIAVGVTVLQLSLVNAVAQRGGPRGVITGHVSQDGRPLSGVLIKVQGASSGVTSDARGNYSIPFSNSSQALWHGILIASCPGYQTQEIRTLNHRVIDITMVRLSDAARRMALPAPQLKTNAGGIYTESSWDLDLMKYHYTRPPDNPAAPGDYFHPAFSGTVVAAAPVIGPYTLQAADDHSINVFGKMFTVEGNKNKDTKAWIYRQTEENNGRLYPASITGPRADYVVATVDGGEPYGMYLMWVENANGAGYPVRINAPLVTWVGPDHAMPGAELNVYGQNLTRDNGTRESYVYIRPWGAGAEVKSIPVRVVRVNPYKVSFVLPDDAKPDSDYEVWLHNGHGGEYGWGGPMKLHVDAANPYVWNGTPRKVTDFGAVGDGVTDNSGAIQAAIDAAADGDRIFFPAGTYRLVAASLTSDKKLLFEGEGASKSIIITDSTFKDTQMLYVKAFPSRVERLKFVTLKPDKQGLHILLRADGPVQGPHAKGFIIANSGFETAAFGGNSMAVGYGINCIGVERVDDLVVRDNYFKTQVSVNAYACDGMVIQNNRIYGNWKVTHGNGNLLMSFPANIKRADISTNLMQSVDHTGDVDDGDEIIVRAIVFQNWHGGRHDRLYIADNQVDRAGSPWDNSGEIILFELPASKTVYNATAVTATTLTLPGSWRKNSLTEQTIAIIKNTGLGQFRRIVANDGGKITIDRPWDVPPDNSSVLSLNSSADNAVIYHNSVDGIPNYFDQESATSGIQLYGCAYDNVIAQNRFNNVHYGIYITGFAAHPTSQVGHSAGCMGTLVTGNTVTNAVYGLEAITVMYPEVMPSSLPDEIPWSSNINTVFRDNVLSNIRDFTVNGVNHGGYGILVGQIYNDWQDPHWNGPWVREALVEHNTVTDAAGKYIWLRQHQGFTTVRKNNFIDTNKYPNTTGVYYSAESEHSVVVDNAFDPNIDVDYDGVLPGPVLHVNMRSLVFNVDNKQDVQSQHIIVRNAGTNALDLRVSSDSDWINAYVTVSDLSDPGDRANLMVRIDARTLNPGMHTGTLTLYNGTDGSSLAIGIKAMVTTPRSKSDEAAVR